MLKGLVFGLLVLLSSVVSFAQTTEQAAIRDEAYVVFNVAFENKSYATALSGMVDSARAEMLDEREAAVGRGATSEDLNEGDLYWDIGLDAENAGDSRLFSINEYYWGPASNLLLQAETLWGDEDWEGAVLKYNEAMEAFDIVTDKALLAQDYYFDAELWYSDAWYCYSQLE